MHLSTSIVVSLLLATSLASTSHARQSTWNHPDRAEAPVPTFAEGTPDHYVLAIQQQLARMYPETSPEIGLYATGTRWPGGEGTPTTITWSFVPDGLVIPGAITEPTSPSVLFSRMNTVFNNNQALWISRIQSAFDRWQALSGIKFVRLTAPGFEWDDGGAWGLSSNGITRGDIRIGMHPIDGTGGTLGYTKNPPEGDVVLDSAENFSVPSANSNVYFRNSMTKHVGFAVGMKTVCPLNSTKLMEPFATTLFDGPQHDDVRGIQRLYGDTNETDDIASLATDIGTLSGTPVQLGLPPAPAITEGSTLSIDADGETDWYRFDVTSTASLNVKLTPRGLTYLVDPNPVTGICPAGTSVNSKAIADLAFEVRASGTGNPILTTVNVSAAGSNEELLNFVLPGAGTYFVRVFETSAPTESQLYRIEFDADPICSGAVAMGGAGCVGSGACEPAIGMTGCPASNSTVTFSLSNAFGGSSAVLLFGLTSANLPASNGCVLRVGTALPFTVTLPLAGAGACQGSISVPTVLPTISSAATIHMQAACGDPGSAGGFTLSNSLVVTFGP